MLPGARQSASDPALLATERRAIPQTGANAGGPIPQLGECTTRESFGGRNLLMARDTTPAANPVAHREPQYLPPPHGFSLHESGTGIRLCTRPAGHQGTLHPDARLVAVIGGFPYPVSTGTPIRSRPRRRRTGIDPGTACP